jgi:hypothetical protein
MATLTPLNRRRFLQASTLAAATPLALRAQPATLDPAAALPTGPLGTPRATLPMGRIGNVEFSRLMLGGNLISGYAHARDLEYVAHLMKRYNSDAKIIETLEIAELHGINVVNSWVRDGIAHLQHHWKRGGKMKWIAQARLDGNGGLDQFKQAADLGAVAIHITGDGADALVAQNRVDKIGETLEFIRSRKCLAGIGAHGLGTILACEDARLTPDFYIKTFHSHDYHTAPRPDETGDLGRYDNSWCKNPEEVAEVMLTIKQPWIAFKVLAAGAIPPQRGFRHAFEGGADFILVGMFDWQIEEDVQITKQVLGNLRRLRPWQGATS